jgi:hypothetical protein
LSNQLFNQSEEIKSLKESVLVLKCRSMKNYLFFTGLNRVQNEDLLRGFLHHELEIKYRIEFGVSFLYVIEEL